MSQLSDEQIKSLLNISTFTPTDLMHLSKHAKFYDRESICTARGCTSPTYFKVGGVSFCTMHGIRALVLKLEKLDPTEGQDLTTHKIETGRYAQ